MLVIWLVLAITAGLLVAVLVTPVVLQFEGRGMTDPTLRVSVGMLFGSLRLGLALPRTRAAPASALPPRRGKSRPRGAALLREPAFRNRLLRLIHDLLRATRVERLQLSMRLGLGDPADTGRLWALLGPLCVARLPRQWQIRLEPDFAQAALVFEASGRLRVLPIRWLILLLSFVLSRPSRQAWRTAAHRA